MLWNPKFNSANQALQITVLEKIKKLRYQCRYKAFLSFTLRPTTDVFKESRIEFQPDKELNSLENVVKTNESKRSVKKIKTRFDHVLFLQSEFICRCLKKLFIFCLVCFVIIKLLKLFQFISDARQKYDNSLLTPSITTEEPRFHSERSSSKAKLTLNDIIITIKSTKKYHSDRISILLDTWVKSAINQVLL